MKSSPDAADWYAFFDVDGTLISIKSMFSFLDHLLRELRLEDSPRTVAYRRTMQRLIADDAPREEINRHYYVVYAGLAVALVERLGREWYAAMREQEGLFYTRMLREIRWHQDRGIRTVLVSGSFHAILQPLADELRIDDVIAAPLQVVGGRYTGCLTGSPSIGRGKAKRIRAYARRRGIAMERCYAYGDDLSDVPMLEAVGHAVAVNPGAALRDISRQRRWSIIETA